MEDTDLFLVNRPGELKTYKQEKGDLMAQLQDSDLLLVNRDDTTYKITGAEFKASIVPDTITPTLDEVLIQPAPISGTGTFEDPFVLKTVIAAPAGTSVSTEETITFFNQTPDAPVTWITSDAIRFLQPVGLVDNEGKWVGQLQYADNPASEANTEYSATLFIGDCYFQWTVEQYVTDFAAPSIDSVDITKTRQGSGGGRYTDCDFDITATMIDDGVPTSVKTFIPKFQGVTQFYEYTGPTTGYNPANSRVQFDDDTTPEGFENFEIGDDITTTEGRIEYGLATSVTRRIINEGYSYNYYGGSGQVWNGEITGTMTVPDNAYYATVVAIGPGGGAQGWSPSWSSAVSGASQGSASPSGGGGGGGTAWINNVACTPGETFSFTIGTPGGPTYSGSDRAGDPYTQATTTYFNGSGWGLQGDGGRMNGTAQGAGSQVGAAGGNYSSGGSSGAGAVYTGNGGASGGGGGIGYRLTGNPNGGSSNPNNWFVMAGGGGGAGGLTCTGGKGGDGLSSGSGLDPVPGNGGYGGGFKPDGSLTNTGGAQYGQDNTCKGGAGGGGARGSNISGDNGNPTSGHGRGAGGSAFYSLIPGGSGAVYAYFSKNGDRDITTNTNMSSSIYQSYEWDVVMGADFAPIAYSLKVGDYLYSDAGNARVKSINGNTIVLESTNDRPFDTASVYYQTKNGYGTISNISNIQGARYFELTGSNDAFIPDQTLRSPNRVNGDGSTVVYGTMANDGVTINGIALNSTEYPFAPDPKSTSMTVKFPETWDSGNSPDSELPSGTAFAVDLTTTNSQGSDTAESNPFSRSIDVLTFNADDTVQRMSDEDNTQLRVNAATYEVRTVAARKSVIDAALLASGVTQQTLDDTYGN